MFDLVEKERRAHIFSQHRNELTDAGIQRLSMAGDIVKTLVSTGLKDFKSKLCRQILTHIADSLLAPTSRDRLCMPLLDAYSKTFRMIVEAPAHTEHLPHAEVQTYLTFLCNAVDSVIESLGTSIDTMASVYVFADNTPNLAKQRRLPYAAAELLQSIYLLIATTSGISTNQLNDIWETVGRYINSTTESSSGDVYAINIANVLLSLSSTENWDFCERVSLLVFERLTELWKSKSMPVREALLVFLQYSFPFTKTVATKLDEAPENIQHQFSSSVSEMVSNILSETTFASVSMSLLPSDIDINESRTDTSACQWFTQTHFHLKPTGNSLAWMTMLSYHHLTVLDYIISFSSFASRLKKRRVVSNANSEIMALEHHIFSEAISGLDGEKEHYVRKLQALVVHMHYDIMPDFLVATTFDALRPMVNSAHVETSAWALLAVSYLLHAFPSYNFELAELDNLWNVTCKRFYHPELSCISSFFLTTMLSQNRVPASVRKPRVERLLGMFDSSGPSLSNGSIYLVRQLLRAFSSSMFDKLQDAIEKVMFWLMKFVQVDYDSKSKSLLSISPSTVASLILELCGLQTEFNELRQYTGVFQLEALKYGRSIIGMEYLTTGKIQIAGNSKAPKNSIELSSTVSTEVISNIINNLTEECSKLSESMNDTENSMKFSSYPMLYEQVINFIGTMQLTTLVLEKNNAVFSSRCRELMLKLQSLFAQLCSIANTLMLQEEHVRYILRGMANFNKVYPQISDLFYLEVYRQELDSVLRLFSQEAPSSGSFEDEIKESTELIKAPLPTVLHMYDTLKSFQDSQLYIVYAETQLLHTKLDDNVSFLESICRLFQNAKSTTDVAAIGFAFIDRVFEVDQSSPLSALDFQKLIREIGGKLLSSYEWDRAESTLLLCISLLHNFASVWTTNDTIRSDCFDILNWLCKLIFDGGYRNYRVQSNLTFLLAEIMKYTPELIVNEDKSLPGSFGMLIADTPDLSYRCANLLPEVFQHYPINSHITFFNGVQDVMGQVHQEKELLAARCYVLTYLAQSSDSIVTGAVFNLLELADFQEAHLYIEHAIGTLSNHYNASSLQSFLMRQAEELFYLWFSNGVDNGFPFQFFGYSSEEEFLCEYHDIISVLLVHFDKQNGFSQIKEIGHKINSKNTDVLLMPALPISWAYEFTTGTGDPKDIGFAMEVGTDKWKKSTTQGLCVFVASLMLLIDFSVVPSTLCNTSSLFGDVYVQFKPTVLVSFPQPLIKPHTALKIVHQVLSLTPKNIELSAPNHFTIILRTIINKIVKSIDPIQKCINLRRLLFFASNFGEREISGYALEMLLKAIAPLVSQPVTQNEALVALKTLMGLSSASLCLQPGLFFEVSLRCLKIAFQDKREGKKLDVFFLRDFYPQIAEAQMHPMLKAMFCWLEDERSEFDINFVYNFNHAGKTVRRLMLDIIAMEMNDNTGLQDHLQQRVLGESPDFIQSIMDTDCAPTKGYKLWMSRLLGQKYLSTGVSPMSEVPIAFTKELTLEADPMKSIFQLVVQLLEDENLEVVNYAEEVIRNMQTHKDSNFKLPLLEILEPSFLQSMDYLYFPKDYSLTHFKYRTIAESGRDTRKWIFQLCSTLLVSICVEYSELESLNLLVLKVPKFAKEALPYLVHLYLKTCVAKRNNPELDELFNSCLNENGNSEVRELIIATFFHLRANKLSKDRLGKRYIGLNIESGVQSCLTNNRPETALMLAEIDWSNSELNNTQFDSASLTQNIFEKVNDPDMFYAVPAIPDLFGAVKTFSFENNNTRLLQYQSAFLNESMVTPENTFDMHLSETLQNTGMVGISKIVSDSMSMEDEKNLYAQAWKLQQWDLAYSSKPESSEEVLFNLHKAIIGTGSIEDSICNAYDATLSLLFSSKSTDKNAILETLSIVYECEQIMTIEDTNFAQNVSQLQIERSQEWMALSR